MATIVVKDPVLAGMLRRCLATLDTKGADYTEGRLQEDRFRNFNLAAADMKVPRGVIWYVYFFKHLTAVRRFAREGKVDSEPIDGRIMDCVNYLFLLWGMAVEDKACPNPAKDKKP